MSEFVDTEIQGEHSSVCVGVVEEWGRGGYRCPVRLVIVKGIEQSCV